MSEEKETDELKSPIFGENEAQEYLESVLKSLIDTFGKKRINKTLRKISISNKSGLE